MLFLLLACSANDDDHDENVMPPCEAQEAYKAHADALRALADLRELCGYLPNPYDVAQCFAPAPAMPTIGPMISCEQHEDAADNLEVWLENTRLEFSTVCRVDTNCRQALTRMSMNRVMYYRLAD